MALSRWQRTIVNETGDIQPFAQITVLNEETQGAAAIYADRDGNSPLAGGVATADASGFVYFYTEVGRYRIQSAGLQIDWRDVEIGGGYTLLQGGDDANFSNPPKINGVALGSAATKNVTTSSTDNTSGRLLKVGDFGIGSYTPTITDIFSNSYQTTFFSTEGTSSDLPSTYMSGIKVARSSNDRGMIIAAITTGTPRLYFTNTSSGGWDNPWQTIYHTGNTTKDGNGVLSASSPVIQLYNDKIESSGFDKETPQFTRVSKGVYQITGTSGLALEGWYIRTPEDRNGNKYFNIDWEQDITPELNEKGYVDEPQNVTLIIRTFERVWNPQTGVYENGSPVDVNELQDRFISLRFNEVQPEEEE